MTWAAIIKLLLSLVLSMVNHARRQNAIDEGEALTVARALKESLDAMDKANRARDDAHRKFDESNGVPDDSDPNLRD